MSRRNKAVKRPVPPDPRYDSQTVSKFLNNLMSQGKKSVAEGIFYRAMDMIEERTGQPGVTVFKQAVANVKPALEVGKWKHVAITFDGKTLTGYLDGQKTESTEATFNLQGVGLTIAQAHNGENSFEGAFDDVRVYGRALTDKEVADLAKPTAK